MNKKRRSVIKELRKKMKISQAGLAKNLDISQAHISWIENRFKYPSPELAKKILKFCEVYGVDAKLSDFYEWDLIKKNPKKGDSK